MTRDAIPDAAIRGAFASFDPSVRDDLLQLRRLIFDIALQTDGVGAVQETLKWGQPSYATRSGTPIRLGQPKTGGYAIFTHCQSRVIPDFRALFPADFKYDGSRAVLFDAGQSFDTDKLALLIRAALTYRIKPRQRMPS